MFFNHPLQMNNYDKNLQLALLAKHLKTIKQGFRAVSIQLLDVRMHANTSA